MRFLAAFRRAAAPLILSGALAALPPAARADIKIISEVTASGLPPQARAQLKAKGAQQTTVYYKGDSVRTEVAGGPITIFQGGTGKWIQIDPARKTYTVNAAQKMMEMAKPFLSMMKIDATGDVKPGEAARTISGYPARNYLINLSMTMSLGEGAPPDAPKGPLFTMTMEGEQWTTEALKLSSSAQRAVVTSVLQMLGPMMQGAQPLMEKMASIQGAPLSGRMTMRFTSAQALPGLPKEPMVVTTEVKSVSEAPLSDTLFRVPAGYKKAEPQMPTPRNSRS